VQLLLKQSASAVDQLQKLFYLTEGEKYLLLSSGVGQGILFADKKHVAIQIVASPDEHKIISTKPQDVLALKKEHEEQKAQEKAQEEEQSKHPSQG
jgi:hypothetical protein